MFNKGKRVSCVSKKFLILIAKLSSAQLLSILYIADGA
ncbi:hypothetical protein BVRB_8g194180 [Beta vulgaris subsp. vulgaris]|nr:hypothetical protein BVRB_8g194180 [Beta vulgaris subsp. vulgaris]